MLIIKKRRRLDLVRREEENEQRHTRREQPRVLGQESIQHATARLDPARRDEEQSAIRQHITTRYSKIRSSKKRGRE